VCRKNNFYRNRNILTDYKIFGGTEKEAPTFSFIIARQSRFDPGVSWLKIRKCMTFTTTVL
jgi:hypothetical protein